MELGQFWFLLALAKKVILRATAVLCAAYFEQGGLIRKFDLKIRNLAGCFPNVYKMNV